MKMKVQVLLTKVDCSNIFLTDFTMLIVLIALRFQSAKIVGV